MEYRSLGRTRMQVSTLCLGAMMFGAWGEPDHDTSIKSSTVRWMPATTADAPADRRPSRADAKTRVTIMPCGRSYGHAGQSRRPTSGTPQAWISDPMDGCRHDSAALACSGVVDTLDPGNWIGDKGYVGNDMITPIKKPPYRDLLNWENEFNTAVNKIRYLIEQTHREPQNLADPPHRLPSTTCNIHHNNLNSNRTTLLRNQLNNPQSHSKADYTTKPVHRRAAS